MSYNQLAESQRYQIDVLMRIGKSQRETARILRVSSSTISRELKRNGRDGDYCPVSAQQASDRRRRKAAKARKLTPTVTASIERLLRRDWSPELISGRLRSEVGIRISHQCIYDHVWKDYRSGGDLFLYLRRCGKPPRRHAGNGASKSKIPNRVGIETRPEIVDERARIGDWEVDTVIGRQGGAALVTLVERKSRFTLIGRVERRYADLVRDSIIGLLEDHRGKLCTITADNGTEFVEHERVSQSLGLDFYFAHAYSAWERGSNEQTNGLIRQYLPKGMSLDDVTEGELEWIMDRLNHRPRKCLDFLTPYEVFYDKAVREAA